MTNPHTLMLVKKGQVVLYPTNRQPVVLMHFFSCWLANSKLSNPQFSDIHMATSQNPGTMVPVCSHHGRSGIDVLSPVIWYDMLQGDISPCFYQIVYICIYMYQYPIRSLSDLYVECLTHILDHHV